MTATASTATRKTSAAGVALIKSVEGCLLTAYLCPAKVWTIGYGHTGPDVFEGQKITKAEAETLLRRDLARFERCVAATCPESTQSQFDAMACLAFNIGEAGFKKSSVARLHNAGRFPEAQQAFALWNKAGGKIVGGLVTRRAREADLYDNDDLPTDVDAMPQAVDGEPPLSKSRAITGQTIAAAATAASMAADSIGASLGQARETLASIMPFADRLPMLLAGLALAGIVYAIYARVHDRITGRS
jgi:lysozyme